MNWCHIYYITSVILYIYSGYVTASEYYVSAASNGEDCPSTDLPCRHLSYYIANYASYFNDDAIFYFLEGTHTLQGILNISNVSNITLQGLGHIEQGFHETVMQSTSVIRCGDSKRATGIHFNTNNNVVLKSLTIANCAFNWRQYQSVSLYFGDIKSVTLECVSVQNSSGNGLVLYNAYDVLIVNSSFANNGDLETYVGNVYIEYNNQINRLSSVSILKSNFTLGLGYGINLRFGYDNKADVIIENSMFSNNIGRYRGGVDIVLFGGGSIEFSNCTLCNNTATYGGGMFIYSYVKNSVDLGNCTLYNNTALYGGGMFIYSYGNNSINLTNCTLYNNTAWYGGGMYISSYANGNIDLDICTLCNNTAQYGGGMYISSYGNGSVDLDNCTIYNNIVLYGGGMYISSYGNGIIDLDNCALCTNTAQYGGGMYITSLNNGIIDLDNCTLYNNTAQYGGGGMYISSYGSRNIDLNKCTLYKNTAQYGARVYINS